MASVEESAPPPRPSTSSSSRSSRPQNPPRRLSLRYLASPLEIGFRPPPGTVPISLLHPAVSTLSDNHSEQYPPTPGSPRQTFTHSPSYDRFVRARRPASITSSRRSNYDPSAVPWRQQSLLTRIQIFSGVTSGAFTQVPLECARPRQVNILSRRSSFLSTTSAASEGSCISTGTVTHHPTCNISSNASCYPSSDENSCHAVLEPESEPQSEQDSSDIDPSANLVEIDHSLFIDEHSQNHPDLHKQDEMNIARSLTSKLRRSESNSSFGFSVPIPERKRPTISLPTLLHTTNQFVRDNQENNTASNESTAPSTPTSEAPSLSNTSSRSSSSEVSPISEQAFSVAPNHLTQYFPADPKTSEVAIVSVTPSDPQCNATEVIRLDEAPPAIPRRAPSHSKREHLRLARQRSVRSSAHSGRFELANESTAGSRPVSTMSDPFSAELAKLDEVAEDFNSLVLETLPEEDERIITNGGLNALTPSVYIEELAEMEKTRWIDC